MFSSATIIAFLLKNWWKIGLGLLVAVILFLAYSKVSGYLQHVRDVEATNKTLSAANATLTGQKTELEQINKSNALVYATQLAATKEDQVIASDESAASTARAQTYKEIRNAITTAPRSSAPVDPVISNTLNSLWAGQGQGTK